MYTELFDITAGGRARAIAQHPSMSQPIVDPIDPRCERRPRSGRSVPPREPRTPRSGRRATGLGSDERSRPAS